MTTHTIYRHTLETRQMMADERHPDGRFMFRSTQTFEGHDWKVVRALYLRMRRAGMETYAARHVITMASSTCPASGDRQPSPRFVSAGKS